MLYDWINDMDFAYPLAFGLFPLLPILIYWYWQQDSKRQASVQVSSTQAFTVRSWKNRFRHLPFILRVLALALIIAALARPQKRHDDERIEGEGIDIVLCMDVSGSMGQNDILPSRMEVAKEMAIEFIQSRPVDRIGLVIFSGEAFTQAPLTSDRNTVISQIQMLDNRRFLKDGTIIGEGLATAVARLAESTSASKVIILITDGKEDSPDTRIIDPLTALEIAKSKGVKVYTIGVGARGAANPELPGLPGGKKPATTTDFIDEDLLRRIADETGGKYFRARDKEGLKSTYRQIDQMEKSKVEVRSFKQYEELYLPFILGALGLLFLEICLRLTVFKRFP
jgi:Ca-activated chloride channel homolog